jgi:Flp pilus assembly protein TadB
MITLPLLGAGFGAALCFLLLHLLPAQPDPLVQLGRLYAASRSAATATDTSSGGLQARLGRRVADALRRRGIAYTSLRQDLAINGESFDMAIGRKALVAVGGFGLGLLLSVMLAVTGVPLPTGTELVIALGMAALLFVIPDLDAKQTATRRRREFCRALSAYLDWVSLQMSGRAAAAQALPDAARIGTGWPLALIRHTVIGATRAGRDVWDALSELGERIGVTQLRDLGALVKLVEHDGAQVRDTLTARAASLRAEELAEARGTAGKRDQSMLLAEILVGVGFAVFIGYAAVVNVISV